MKKFYASGFFGFSRVMLSGDLIYSPALLFGQLTHRNKYYCSSYPGEQITHCFSIDNIKNIEKTPSGVRFEFIAPLEFQPFFKNSKSNSPSLRSLLIDVKKPDELIRDINEIKKNKK